MIDQFDGRVPMPALWATWAPFIVQTATGKVAGGPTLVGPCQSKSLLPSPEKSCVCIVTRAAGRGILATQACVKPLGSVPDPAKLVPLPETLAPVRVHPVVLTPAAVNSIWIGWYASAGVHRNAVVLLAPVTTSPF